MEIKISEKEITAGVVAYLNTRGFSLDLNNVQIKFAVGRKGNGVSAELVELDSGPQDIAKVETKVVTQASQTKVAVEEPAPKVIDEQEPAKEPEPEPAPEVVVADEQPVVAGSEPTSSLFQ